MKAYPSIAVGILSVAAVHSPIAEWVRACEQHRSCDMPHTHSDTPHAYVLGTRTATVGTGTRTATHS